MDLFFKFASPTTLASLAADLQNSLEWTDEIDDLHELINAELVAIVGREEAVEMLQASGALSR